MFLAPVLKLQYRPTVSRMQKWNSRGGKLMRNSMKTIEEEMSNLLKRFLRSAARSLARSFASLFDASFAGCLPSCCPRPPPDCRGASWWGKLGPASTCPTCLALPHSFSLSLACLLDFLLMACRECACLLACTLGCWPLCRSVRRSTESAFASERAIESE